MASLGPDAQELKKIQKRISDIMRDYTAEQESRQNLLNTIEYVSSIDVQLMSRSTSSSMMRRGLPLNLDINVRVAQLTQELSEKEAAIGRLWNKLAELQERERELMLRSSRGAPS